MATIADKPGNKSKKPWLKILLSAILGTISILSGTDYPYVSIVTAFLCLSALILGIAAIPKKSPGTPDSKLHLKLPADYYTFENIHLKDSNIVNIIVCPKGVFTLESSLLNPHSGKEKFLSVKKGILQSKALNDFMQQNKIGNYFVRTILLCNTWDEKLKTYFPDIPLLKPDELPDYLRSQQDKYTADQCTRIKELLELNFKIDEDIHSLKRNIASNVTTHGQIRQKAGH